MPLKKPIISIDVDDGKFKDFLDLFSKYQKALKAMPAGWEAVGGAVEKSGVGVADMAALLGAQAEMLHRLTQEHRELERSASGYGRAMQGAAREVGNIARGIADTTRNLMRWAGIGGLIGIGGGLFGLDHLIGNASSLRTRSLGLGASPGTVLAANTNFGQFLNAQGILSSIANLQQNLSGQIAFNTLGIPGSWNADPGAALTSVLGAVHNLYRQTPAGERQNMPWYQQASQFLSPEEIRTIGNMSDAEFRRHVADYQRDRAGNFGLQAGTLGAAQNVERQLTRVGYTLEYTFLAALKPIMPELESLSTSLGQTVSAFLQGPGFAHLIDLTSTGLHNLAEWIGSDKFEAKVKEFGDDLAYLADVVVKAAKFIQGLIPDSSGPAPGTVTGQFGPVTVRQAPPWWDFHSWFGTGPKPGMTPPPANGRTPWADHPFKWLWNQFTGGSGSANSASVNSAFAASGLPPEAQAFMKDIASGEAKSFNTLAGGGAFSDYSGFPQWGGYLHEYHGQMVRSHGAGMFQDEPGTWAKIAAGAGLTDFSPNSQIVGNWWWAQKTYADATGGRSLLDDLKGHNLDPRGRAALGTQWARGGIATGAGFSVAPTATSSAGKQQFEIVGSGWAAGGLGHLPSMSSKFVFGTDTPPLGAGKPGFDWSGHESQKDLARVRRAIAAAASQNQVTIKIDNQTGGSAVVSASQMQVAY